MYKAYYMPYTERDDPSKGGFNTEDEAWDYVIEHGLCQDCYNEYKKEQEDKNYDGYIPCLAEWCVDEEK